MSCRVMKLRKLIWDKIREEKTLRKIPPLTPSQVLLGEIFGQNRVFPNIEPIKRAPLSVYQAEMIQIRLIACACLNKLESIPITKNKQDEAERVHEDYEFLNKEFEYIGCQQRVTRK